MTTNSCSSEWASVRATEQFQKAEAAERLIKIATGDGMALVFYTGLEAPVRCAMGGRALHPAVRRAYVRPGISRDDAVITGC